MRSGHSMCYLLAVLRNVIRGNGHSRERAISVRSGIECRLDLEYSLTNPIESEFLISPPNITPVIFIINDAITTVRNDFGASRIGNSAEIKRAIGKIRREQFLSRLEVISYECVPTDTPGIVHARRRASGPIKT